MTVPETTKSRELNRVLALDIGNSQMTGGLFEDDELKSHFFTESTDLQSSLDQILSFSTGNVIISSVVPERSLQLANALATFKLIPRILRSGDDSIIKGCYPTMGSDRIANLIAVRKLFGEDKAHIVIDCGTATTLSSVDAEGNFSGGFITLGYGATLDMLSKRTAQLPHAPVALAREDILGFDTESSILNGTLIGHIALIDAWIKSAHRVLSTGNNSTKIEVTATGGWSNEFANRSELTQSIDRVDPLLTIKGVYLAGAAVMDPADRV